MTIDGLNPQYLLFIRSFPPLCHSVKSTASSNRFFRLRTMFLLFLRPWQVFRCCGSIHICERSFSGKRSPLRLRDRPPPTPPPNYAIARTASYQFLQIFPLTTLDKGGGRPEKSSPQLIALPCIYKYWMYVETASAASSLRRNPPNR